jgi:amidase
MPWQPTRTWGGGATAWQIANSVRRGDATAAQVVADHLDHARVADRILGAVRHLRAGAAIAEAEQVDEQPDLLTLPLAGVPVLIHQDVALAGLPSGPAPDALASADHEIVRRLRGAGAIVLGTSREHGQSRSPWRTDRASGTGAAAAVASGIVPIAVDARGDFSAYGGVLALLPGRAATARRSTGTDTVRPVVVATNAADAALGLAVVTGREPATLPTRPRLRVAIAPRGPVLLARPDGGVRRSVTLVAEHIVAQCHDAVLAVPPRHRRLAPADWRDRCVAFFAGGGFDAVLLPTAAGWPDLGLPLLCLPSGVHGAGLRDAGLPGGVLLVGAPGADLRLLALASQMETAAPWQPHAPTWPRLNPRSWWTTDRQ